MPDGRCVRYPQPPLETEASVGGHAGGSDPRVGRAAGAAHGHEVAVRASEHQVCATSTISLGSERGSQEITELPAAALEERTKGQFMVVWLVPVPLWPRDGRWSERQRRTVPTAAEGGFRFWACFDAAAVTTSPI